MADLSHTSSRIVAQQPSVVHDRILELAERLRDEAPDVPEGSQAAAMLGTSGRLGIQIADRGPSRIECRTTEGRIRVEAAADIGGRPDGRTEVTLAAAVKPQGFAANLMLGAALGARPAMKQQVVDGIEGAFDELAVELAKPDDQWDASKWKPPGLGS